MAKVQIKSEKLAFLSFFRLWGICNALLAQIIDFSLGLRFNDKTGEFEVENSGRYLFSL